MNEYVALTSHKSELYALTKYGEIYRIDYIDTRNRTSAKLVMILPIQGGPTDEQTHASAR